MAVLTAVAIVGLHTHAQDVETTSPIRTTSASLAVTIHPPIPTSPSDFWFVPDVARPSAGRAESAAEKFARGARFIDDGEFLTGLPLVSAFDLYTTPLANYGQYYRAIALFGLNRQQEAKDTLDSLSKKPLQGYLAEAVAFRLADALISSQDASGALAVLTDLQANKPVTTPEDVWMRIGRAAEASGDRARALQAYQKVYYEYPLSTQSNDAEAELDRLDNATLSERLPKELVRAERLFAARRWAQSRGGFSRLAPIATGDDASLIALRLAECDYYLERYRGSRDALRPFLSDSPREAEARYFYLSATRALGDVEAFIAQANALVTDFPDSQWTAEALNSLASYYVVSDYDAKADDAFRALYQRFPDHRYSERAAWKIGWYAYKNGRYADAAQAFESGAATFPRADTRPAWLYWAGRAHDQLGDTLVANDRYRLEVADYNNSYYGRLASTILATRHVPAGPANVTNAPTMATPQIPTGALIRQLVDLDLYDLALKELQYAQRAWGDAPAIQATIAWIRHDQAHTEVAPDRFDHLRGAINMMKRAYPQYLAAGGQNLPPAVLEVIYPLDYWPLISKYSEANNLDPYLMAALIAQESTFTADVRSGASAVGLMQLMPATGRRFAKRAGIPTFSRATLTNPESNIKIGMTYFKELIDRFGSAHLALASYNAGESRVSQWLSERPGVDQDQFIDDIPYPETQGYVKRILGTAEDYRRLYSGGPLAPVSASTTLPPTPRAGASPKLPTGARVTKPAPKATPKAKAKPKATPKKTTR